MTRRRTTRQPAAAWPPPWPGLYLGAGPQGPVCAGPERAALILGPPRSGNTSAIVAPVVLCAPGAVVTTSTKTDVLTVTGNARSRRGRIWLYDPSGTTSPPAGVQPLCWSPVPGCADWDTAVATAHALVRAARPGGGLEHANHWTERAQALLAPLLHAADLLDKDVSWVMRWVLRAALIEPLGILAKLADEFATDTLISVVNTEERERSAVLSTTAGVLAAYRSRAALTQATHPSFDPDTFVASSDTVYVAAPANAQDQTAPLVVALLERIRTATYRRPAGAPPVVWALDEAANIAPFPTLPAIVAEGGSQGLLTLCCLQDLSQARTRWGHADGFLSLFSAKVVLPGIADLRTLELISTLAGEHDVIHQTVNRPRGLFTPGAHTTVSTGTQRQKVLPPDAISRGLPGMALLLRANDQPSWIRLTPWWTPPWNQIVGGAQ